MDTEQKILELEGKLEELQNLFLNHAHQKNDQTPRIPTTRFELQDDTEIVANADIANHFYCTLGGNRTLANPLKASDGQTLVFELIQDGTGNRTISLDTKFVAGPFTITLSTTADERDFLECKYNAIEDLFYITNFVKGY